MLKRLERHHSHRKLPTPYRWRCWRISHLLAYLAELSTTKPGAPFDNAVSHAPHRSDHTVEIPNPS